MPHPDHADLRPPRRTSRSGLAVLLLLVVLALGAVAYWWYTSQRAGPGELPGSTSADLPGAASSAAALPAPVASGPQFPVGTDLSASAPADAQAQVGSALTGLVGGKAVDSLLQVDGFVQRFVATVDNLPRSHAPARMWPVQPTAERFTVVDIGGGAQAISPDNSARYAPFVRLVEALDMKRAVAFYTQHYALFQTAYEELGYPEGYFNDRLVQVIDHLLGAPEPLPPLQVKLTEVKGEVPSQRPWVRYEFADPELEALSAGQKMMVRVGLANERRLKAQLSELRRLVSSGAAAKK